MLNSFMAELLSYEDRAKKVMRTELPHTVSDMAMGLVNYTRFFGGDPHELLNALLAVKELPPKLAKDQRFAIMHATYSPHRAAIDHYAQKIGLQSDQVIKILMERCALPFDQDGSDQP